MKISDDLAKTVGDHLNIDWSVVDLQQFKQGLKVELEHGTKLGNKTNITNNDLVMTGRIALAHLIELPDYYSRLRKIENDKGNKAVSENIVMKHMITKIVEEILSDIKNK